VPKPRFPKPQAERLELITNGNENPQGRLKAILLVCQKKTRTASVFTEAVFVQEKWPTLPRGKSLLCDENT
jgi:hypothetical protein